MEIVLILAVALFSGGVGATFGRESVHPAKFTVEPLCEHSEAAVRDKKVTYERCWRSEELQDKVSGPSQ